eukprot:TRINITY_DN4184_c0_g1_i1.p1 TRINITY_DN4184_c0_g1~~TRINITY_DN4184_c0_g1_i1.p1  ORF type:complete len:429 (+),score=71.65 TRINITY_DN4184_c0_g1_i1:127-1413(+)
MAIAPLSFAVGLTDFPSCLSADSYHFDGRGSKATFRSSGLWVRGKGLRVTVHKGVITTARVRPSRLNVVVAGGDMGTQDQEKQTVQVAFDPKKKVDDFAALHDPNFELRAKSMTLFSPSKINIFLRIMGKRPDGYHELASLFHAISLGDILKFSISPSSSRDSLTTNTAGIPLDGTNLVLKALNLFRMKTGINTYFWVHLDKRVPTGAGLGGGSGNAATALWAANQLCGEPATNADLQQWAGEIGSDIPFFFSSGAAFCTGRGELVEDLLPSPIDLNMPMVLMKPSAACSTADVYRKFSLDSASKADPRALLAAIVTNSITQDTCINDLEAPAFEVLPMLKKFKQRVTASGRGRYNAVFMSGSGSTIVGIGDTEPPMFVYDEDEYADVFVSAASFITRPLNAWYTAQLSGGSHGGNLSSSDHSTLKLS